MSSVTPTRSQIPVRLAVGLLAALMGCSGVDAPTAPAADDPDTPLFSAADAGAKATHDSLMAIAAEARNRFHQEHDRRRGEYETAKRNWQAFRHQLDEAKKKHTTVSIDLLRCEPQEYAGDAQVIGPNGGTIHIGKHAVKIPKGALDHEVVISGEAPVSELVEVELEPHGLTFARPAKLKLNYDNCVVPSDLDLYIVYLNNSGDVVEIRPSVDKKGLSTVVGLLDHFSRYALAW